MKFFILLSMEIIFSMFASRSWGLEAPVISSGLNPWQAKIVEEFKSTYAPLTKTHPLIFESQLNDHGVVASVQNDGDAYIVKLSGGLLISPRLSEDGFRIVICHELGHHFGGAPRRHAPREWDGPVAPDGLSLSSSEAQADYAATATCFRKMVRGQNHSQHLDSGVLTARVIKLCEKVWGEKTEESLICQRGVAGGWNMLQLVMTFPISLERSDEEVVSETITDTYPSRQCRLDTLVAGSLCKKDFPLQLDFDDPHKSECPNVEGLRPPCWYKP